MLEGFFTGGDFNLILVLPPLNGDQLNVKHVTLLGAQLMKLTPQVDCSGQHGPLDVAVKVEQPVFRHLTVPGRDLFHPYHGSTEAVTNLLKGDVVEPLRRREFRVVIDIRHIRLSPFELTANEPDSSLPPGTGENLWLAAKATSVVPQKYPRYQRKE